MLGKRGAPFIRATWDPHYPDPLGPRFESVGCLITMTPKSAETDGGNYGTSKSCLGGGVMVNQQYGSSSFAFLSDSAEASLFPPIRWIWPRAM